VLRILNRISPTRPAPPEPPEAPVSAAPATPAQAVPASAPAAPAPGWSDLRTKLQDRLTTAAQTLPGSTPTPGVAPNAPKSGPR
jgi:hypothetical protein